MFEGSEKKIEVIFSPKSPSLRSLPEKFWQKTIKACGASIITSSKFSFINSYILSESSLFLWDHRLVLITCGRTTLPNSLLKIIKTISKENIEIIFYQKKNEFFPWAQKSHFSKDVDIIEKNIKGSSYQFGPFHDHHFLLFHNETDYRSDAKDNTLEILMYDSSFITNTSQKIISNLKKQLEIILPGFEMQEHFFQPSGYSLNAVRENFYYTIHITPEKPFFYVSFETNFEQSSSHVFIDKLLSVFKSRSFDLILFKSIGQSGEHYNSSEFLRNAFYHQVLDCGYEVSYMNFYQIQNTPKTPWVYKDKKWHQTKYLKNIKKG